MKIQVKHSLKTDVDSAFKLCTEQKSQETIYGKLPGTDVKIKREGRAPNVKLRISRKMPANPPVRFQTTSGELLPMLSGANRKWIISWFVCTSTSPWGVSKTIR